MLTWGSATAIGHDAFDRDHRQLIAMANLLADALALGDITQASGLACDLEAKAVLHCRHEHGDFREEMDGIGAPRSHCRVGDLAAAVRLAIRAGEIALAGRLTAALEDSIAQAVDADRRAVAIAQARVAAGLSGP